MKHLVLFFVFTALLALGSCDTDKRNKLVGGNFTVFYFNQSEAQVAKKVAFFWKENGFLTGNKQDLQVRKENKRFTVSMIAKDPKSIDNMSIDEVQHLAQLKKKLYTDVFNQSSFTLEICNNRFEPIYTVE